MPSGMLLMDCYLLNWRVVARCRVSVFNADDVKTTLRKENDVPPTVARRQRRDDDDDDDDDVDDFPPQTISSSRSIER